MNKLSKKEWQRKIQEVQDSEEVHGQHAYWLATCWAIEQSRLHLAGKVCRSCKTYGAPDIKPDSWIHAVDSVGTPLYPPHTCSAAAIWAAELIGE